MNSIDLRSDTVTWPTSEMRQVMHQAEVGDDVYGEDPTANRLEELAAKRLGKEAALFVSSGTQANLIAILAHCGRGDEMIVGHLAHTFINEAAGTSALGGVSSYVIPTQLDGTLLLDDIRVAIRDPRDIHYPTTRQICLENTNGAMGGLPLSVQYTRSVGELCSEYGLNLHIDGARIWNAATALGCNVQTLAAPADSISFCLSKGLCAPAGSILCGPHDFIERGRRLRKMLGGGMRQIGILAAAGIIAIEKMTTRLQEDHDNARRLAEGLSDIPGIHLNLKQVQTNMVFFRLADSTAIDATQMTAALAREHNIRLDVRGPRSFRAVTHYWITPERVDITLAAIRQVLESI
ncbi:MAG: low-specificity L-threonine aldolase [Anaerolineae bacterium]|nr:low-specificity L-threonine aldolase [Anaerolineae bacterium]